MELGVIMDNDENSGVCGLFFFFCILNYQEILRGSW